MILISGSLFRDRTHRRHVLVIENATDAIRQKTFGEAANESIRPVQHRLPKTCRSVELRTVVQLRARVDANRSVIDAPASDGVEVFECQSDRIHDLVTAAASWTLAMVFHSFSYRQDLFVIDRFLQRRNHRRRKRSITK